MDINELSYDELEKHLREKHLAKNLPDATAHDVFRMAWEDGHAYGNSEVEIHYIDLSILVNDATLRGRVHNE